ncbi:transmembrane protein, putative [Medicago truncatula]|uniref:Transmembrane protein, putative n=1 Tax=Medicago truncatula TaxID=3880 RepID=G7KMV0_MEDTR|nr:transmembrane protein, putative [Medicago truncatula]
MLVVFLYTKIYVSLLLLKTILLLLTSSFDCGSRDGIEIGKEAKGNLKDYDVSVLVDGKVCSEGKES